MASGRKVTTKSPLADFHEWMVIARERIDRDGVKQADVFRDGWRLGASRARRSAPPASSRQPDRFAKTRRSSAAVASAATAGATERRAQPGELCTCGRPARDVFLTERHGDVGYCGLSNPAPVLPCPFCGTTEAHRQPGGRPGPLPGVPAPAGNEG